MFKIAYAAGHHLGNPKGIPTYMGLGDIREWTLNDKVADYFARAALEYEDVELLRLDDSAGKTLIELEDRAAAANKWGADFVAEFHHNGGIDGGTGGGVVAFSYPGSVKGKEYRDAIYEAVIAAGGLKGNRYEPVQEKAWDILRFTSAPAVLMEYGFMDSRTDAPIIITDAYSKLVAYATMEGIAKAAGLRKKAAKVDKSEDKHVEYSLAMRQLQEGCEGEDVRALQILLNGRGYSCGTADGIFGQKTGDAVEQCQRERSLGIDRIAGVRTMGALMGT